MAGESIIGWIVGVAALVAAGWGWRQSMIWRQRYFDDAQNWADARATLLAQAARLEAELAAARSELQQKLEAERARHWEALEALEKQHQQTLAALTERHRMELAARDQQHQEALAARDALQAERDAAWREKLALLESARETLTREFQTIAHQLFEEKSQRFTALNQEQLSALLNPLRERLDGFRQKVEEIYVTESKDRAAIAEQVRQLMRLNQTLSEEARQLTHALKGTQQTQGAWGEIVLERLLELAGLHEGREYFTQVSHTVDGERLRPDVVVQLPGDRVLVIDAKVSLTAYTEAVAATEDAARERALNAHVASIRRHIDGLAKRHYPALFPGKTLDFVVLFVAVEPAFLAALERAPTLFAEAWDKNVLLTSPSTLLFVLRTVEHLWRQEAQSRNAQEIAQRGAELYDKLVGFLDAMTEVKQRLAQANRAFETAEKRLVSGRGSLIRQAEQLKALGVKPKKTVPEAWSEQAAEFEGEADLTQRLSVTNSELPAE